MPDALSTDDREEAPPPARPAVLGLKFVEDDEELTLFYKDRSGTRWFLLLWLIGWSGGCVMLISEVLREPKLFMILFGIPFWASWIAIAGYLLFTFTSRQCLRLNAEGVLVARSSLFGSSLRLVTLDQALGFQSQNSLIQQEGSPPSLCLQFRTTGRNESLFEAVEQQVLTWLIKLLNQRLQALQSEHLPDPPDVFEEEADPGQRFAAAAAQLAYPIWARHPEPMPVVRPAETTWHYQDDLHELRFKQRGRWKFSSLLGLLFVNGFWNGIVAVFTCVELGLAPMQGVGEKWVLVLFLIPFQVIGLLMIVGLLNELLLPWRRRVWTIRTDGIEHRTGWGSLLRTREYPVVGLDRLEIQRAASRWQTNQDALLKVEALDQTDEVFTLAVIDRENNTLVNWPQLTQAEARWIADVILRERSDWFR